MACCAGKARRQNSEPRAVHDWKTVATFPTYEAAKAFITSQGHVSLRGGLGYHVFECRLHKQGVCKHAMRIKHADSKGNPYEVVLVQEAGEHVAGDSADEDFQPRQGTYVITHCAAC